MICVPLFLIITGYLMKNKQLTKKYYFGILRILIIYILSVISYYLYHVLYINDYNFSIKTLIGKILSIDEAYSWYIKMYIGLFLLIPFINLIYNNLKNRKEKNILLITLLITTSLQGIFNIKHVLIPNWWQGIYPITYYFIGCYLNEYKINLSKIKNIFLFIFVLFISSAINIFASYQKLFVAAIHNDWGSILNVATTTLMFIFIINLDLSKINIIIKRIIIKVSELSLGTYLMSAIVDNYIYIKVFPGLSFCSLKNYFVAVPLVLILSISLSMIINIIYKFIDKTIINCLKRKIL